MSRMAEQNERECDHRQLQEQDELEQWLSDPIARAEYQQYLKEQQHGKE